MRHTTHTVCEEWIQSLSTSEETIWNQATKKEFNSFLSAIQICFFLWIRAPRRWKQLCTDQNQKCSSWDSKCKINTKQCAVCKKSVKRITVEGGLAILTENKHSDNNVCLHQAKRNVRQSTGRNIGKQAEYKPWQKNDWVRSCSTNIRELEIFCAAQPNYNFCLVLMGNFWKTFWRLYRLILHVSANA